MRESTLRVVAAVIGFSVTGAARAEVVTLESLERRALEQHALLLVSAARERAAEADVRQAESAYRPRIGLQVDSNVAPGRRLITIHPRPLDPDPEIASQTATVQGVNAFGKNQPSPLIPQWRSSANLTIGASLYDFGRTRATVAGMRARHQASKSAQEQTRAEIVAGVRGAYLAWLSAHELHRLAVTASSDASARSQRVSALIQEGARPRGDLSPVEGERLLSQLESERNAGDLEGARLVLEQAVGEPLPESAEPDLTVLAREHADAPADRVDPALRILAHERAALEATAQVQRRQRAPLLSASAGVGAAAQLSQGGQWKALPSYAVGLSLVVPLWDGGSSEAAAQAAEARADEVRVRLEGAEREHVQALERARRDAEHAGRRAETAEQLLAVAQARVRDVEAGYDMGAMQFEQVQAARTMLRRAETELVLARVAHAEAVLRVAP